MRKLLNFTVMLMILLMIPSFLFALRVQTWKTIYSTTTERSKLILKGDFYVSESTNTADADVVLQSGSNYPLIMYEGDLKINTTGYGITFADGSLQTTAGVGSAGSISSTGTVVINSDSDNSSGESIIFRTAGAAERMRIKGNNGYVGILNNSPIYPLDVTGAIRGNRLFSYDVSDTTETIRAIIGRGNDISVGFNSPDLINNAATFAVKRDFNIAGWDTSVDFNPSWLFLDVDNDRIGINDYTPSYTLDVNGTIGIEGLESLSYDITNKAIEISTNIVVNGDIIMNDDNTDASQLIIKTQVGDQQIGWEDSGTGTPRESSLFMIGRGTSIVLQAADTSGIIKFYTGGIAAGNKIADFNNSGLFLDGAIDLEGAVVIDYDSSNHEIDFSTGLNINGGVKISTQTRVFSVAGPGFGLAESTTVQWSSRNGVFKSDDDYIDIYGTASVNLPNGAIIISVRADWFRNDASASGDCDLFRRDNTGVPGLDGLATVDSDASSGDHSVTDTSITNAVIDNDNYSYFLQINVDPNNNDQDVYFYQASITYGIQEPLP